VAGETGIKQEATEKGTAVKAEELYLEWLNGDPTLSWTLGAKRNHLEKVVLSPLSTITYETELRKAKKWRVGRRGVRITKQSGAHLQWWWTLWLLSAESSVPLSLRPLQMLLEQCRGLKLGAVGWSLVPP
jgi:hypothetical protein